MNYCIIALHVTCWQPYLYLLPDQGFAQHSDTKARHHQWCLWRHAWNTQALKDVSLQAANPKPRLCTTEVQVMHVQKCSYSAFSQTYCDISSGLVHDRVYVSDRQLRQKGTQKGRTRDQVHSLAHCMKILNKTQHKCLFFQWQKSKLDCTLTCDLVFWM